MVVTAYLSTCRAITVDSSTVASVKLYRGFFVTVTRWSSLGLALARGPLRERLLTEIYL